MKKLGIAAAILLVALLVTGVASALDTAQTTDGQTISVRTIKVDNITSSGDHWILTGKPEKITLKQIDSDTGETSDGQIIKLTTIKVDDLTSLGVSPEGIGFDKIKIGVIHDPSAKGVSGSVAPGYADLWGPFSWSAGYQASVSATWTPTNQGVYLGIYDMANPSWSYIEMKTGGSGFYSRSVPYSSSQWAYAIVNPGSNSATVDYTLN